jgi:hypothetical protein
MASSVSSAITQANNEFNAVVGKQKNGANLDKNAFMLLLVTQFKYPGSAEPYGRQGICLPDGAVLQP